MDTASVSLNAIAQHFAQLADPRSEVNRYYPLTEVIVIALLAILAGANGPAAIAVWAKLHQVFLLNNLSLKDSVPRKDVCNRSPDFIHTNTNFSLDFSAVKFVNLMF